jgi:Ser-Thr-rich glycosyl-phosphatidyl-inositol-anchored membrane family
MKKISYCVSFCLFALSLLIGVCQGQSIELKFVEIKQNKVVVHFDILDSLEARFYSIRVYSSVDGFLNPLEKVSGDVGLEVRPGKNKTVTWTASEELSSTFKDKVSLEIRGRIFIPFISTESINQYKLFKRRRKYELTWKGGSPQNILNFDLYKGEKKITSFTNVSNVGHHTFEFATHVRPGKGYRFKISDVKNKEEVVYTNQFTIRRKIPLLLKVLPLVAVGVALNFLNSTPAGESDIRDPNKP